MFPDTVHLGKILGKELLPYDSKSSLLIFYIRHISALQMQATIIKTFS